MATYRERLEWLIKNQIVGTGMTEGNLQNVLWANGVEMNIPYGIKTIEEAIDWAIENGIGGTSE